MNLTDASSRFSLPLCPEVCLVCGGPPSGPHDEECPVPEHEAMLAGDKVATAVHDPDECHLCLSTRAVRCTCRCGRCCESLIIEATAFDGRREPKIRERCSPITEGGLVPLEQADWLLNGPGGPCVFFHRDQDGRGVCEIHATRPLVCRLFDCDTDERMSEYRVAELPGAQEQGVTP